MQQYNNDITIQILLLSNFCCIAWIPVTLWTIFQMTRICGVKLCSRDNHYTIATQSSLDTGKCDQWLSRKFSKICQYLYILKEDLAKSSPVIKFYHKKTANSLSLKKKMQIAWKFLVSDLCGNQLIPAVWETQRKLRQACNLESFPTIINGFLALNILAKLSILFVCGDRRCLKDQLAMQESFWSSPFLRSQQIMFGKMKIEAWGLGGPMKSLLQNQY